MAKSAKAIISCAVTGAIHTPSMSPYIPIKPDEIIAAAVGAAEAGAAIIHLHARDPENGRPDQTIEAFGRFLPQIKQQTSAVINITSVGAANRTIYCASKWALEGFTKALAVELGPKAIRVNTVGPTFIETPMTAPFLADPKEREAIVSKIKLGRLGAPGDVVGAVAFLASDAAAMVTGSAILVDGGWTAD